MAALRRKDLAVTYSAIDMINSLMHSVNADHDLKQEQLNKSSILSSESFLKTLLDMWVNHVVSFLFLLNSNFISLVYQVLIRKIPFF